MPGAVRKRPAGGGPALLVLLAVPMGAAGGLGALIALAHILPQLPRYGGGALGTFVAWGGLRALAGMTPPVAAQRMASIVVDIPLLALLGLIFFLRWIGRGMWG